MENETIQETERPYWPEMAQSTASPTVYETPSSLLSTPTIRSDWPFYISSASYSAGCSPSGRPLNIPESTEESSIKSRPQIRIRQLLNSIPEHFPCDFPMKEQLAFMKTKSSGHTYQLR